MVDPLLGLLLLWAFSRSGSAPGGGGSLFPSPRAGKPADKGGGGASKFPVTPPAPSVPPRAQTPAGKWKPYAPLNPQVIARANALLRDKGMAINAEVIEPDPAGGGVVRYWKVNQPPGKISVTAWRPNLAQQAPRPAGNAPPSPRVMRSALSTTKRGAAPSPGRLARGGLARGAGGGPGFGT